jgi:hypothetical protein
MLKLLKPLKYVQVGIKKEGKDFHFHFVIFKFYSFCLPFLPLMFKDMENIWWRLQGIAPLSCRNSLELIHYSDPFSSVLPSSNPLYFHVERQREREREREKERANLIERWWHTAPSSLFFLSSFLRRGFGSLLVHYCRGLPTQCSTFIGFRWTN